MRTDIANDGFRYVPYSPEKDSLTACGRPISLDVSKEWADKRVVLFSVPGAFTPTCSEQHLPGYIRKMPELKQKGVDVVAVLAFNDAWVMNAWAKANGVKNDDIFFLEDTDAAFSKSIGWVSGQRTMRYAMVINKGTVEYAAVEKPGELEVSWPVEIRVWSVLTYM